MKFERERINRIDNRERCFLELLGPTPAPLGHFLHRVKAEYNLCLAYNRYTGGRGGGEGGGRHRLPRSITKKNVHAVPSRSAAAEV